MRVTSLRVDHLLGIPVICGDTKHVAGLLASIIYGFHGFVGRANGNDRGVVNTSVADHVGGSKVAHDKLVIFRLDNLGYLVGNALHAHFGLFVIGGHLGRGDHDPLLAVELLLHAAVEEEGDMGVLFGL